MAVGVLALAGTRKGLFLLQGDDDRHGWQVDGPLLDGWGVTRDRWFPAPADCVAIRSSSTPATRNACTSVLIVAMLAGG